MKEHEPTHLEQAPQKPKTMAEHRAEFTEQYAHVLTAEATWTEEDGREVEGRVYDIDIPYSEQKFLKYPAQFRLKARQAGFQIVDRIMVPNVDYGTGQGIQGTTPVNQFYLEGKPLPANSPRGQMLQAPLQQAK